MNILSKIVIARKGEWLNRYKPYRIFINGFEVESIKSGAVQEFTVTAGQLEIVAKMWWYSSNKYHVEIKDGQTIFLQLKNGMRFIQPISIMMMSVILALLVMMKIALISFHVFDFVLNGYCLFLLLYCGYYATIGRNKYLSLQLDRLNPITQKYLAMSN